MNRITRSAIVFLAMALLSCFALPSAASTQTAVAMHGQPKYSDGFSHFDYTNPDAPKQGTLKLAATGSFDSLTPFLIRGQPALGLNTGGYMSLLYETLMTRSADEPFTLYGLIAESIIVAEDRSSITFNLNPNAHWSDGKPITADDVMFSFITLRDHGRPNHRTYYKKVEKAEKLNDQQVRFTFKPNNDGTIDQEMPLIMGLLPILPQHDWQDRDFNQTTLRIPVGSGPYKITAVTPGRSITYMRDPNYWGKDLAVQRGMYNFDQIHVDYYRDDSIALQAFKSGQFDIRRENDPTKWATSYDFPASRDGRVKLERLEHRRTEPAYGFVLNTRREIFKDPAMRAALQYTFDFEWINRTLFHGQYKPTTSFFPNSELSAPTLPMGKELEILNKYRSQLPADIFTTPIGIPKMGSGEGGFRNSLLKASAILHQAGYTTHNNTLYTPSGQPIAFEILLSDPIEEKVALAWVYALKQIGIDANIHTVDSAQYQRRLGSFNYDVTTGRWFNSQSPGNEQMFFWGSAAADQPGSRNYPGVKDPVVDALANAIPATHTREDLIATTHALDRVLMAGHYIVPFYYLGVDNYAYWAGHLHHPETIPPYGLVQESWWYQ